jgi:hypothetical protein
VNADDEGGWVGGNGRPIIRILPTAITNAFSPFRQRHQESSPGAGTTFAEVDPLERIRAQLSMVRIGVERGDKNVNTLIDPNNVFNIIETTHNTIITVTISLIKYTIIKHIIKDKISLVIL